jgi:pseudouridylate synthase
MSPQATVRRVGTPDAVTLHPEVGAALADGRGVVALESTIISHGLPTDTSVEVARQIEAAVRDAGAVPATIAVVGGRVRVGLDEAAFQQVATDPSVVKASIRDLGVVLASGGVGATTVASTALVAHRAGIRVFATGGLGGVHRGGLAGGGIRRGGAADRPGADAEHSWDESADLMALASTPITVVCAGVKSILDVPATLERLESLSVSVVGYRTDAFPGFYIRDAGVSVPWRLDSLDQIVAVSRQRAALDLRQALVVANPIPASAEMDRALHDSTLDAALHAAHSEGISGKDVTPFLIGYFHDKTHGASLRANIALVLSNARLAGQLAAADADFG